MIKNILFDMGGVVFQQDTEQAFSRFRHAGVDPDKFMGIYGQRGFFLDVETGAITGEEFCQAMSAEAGHEVTWAEAQYCWLGFMVDVPPEGLQRLLELKQRYHVCLLSNTNPFIMAHQHSAAFSGDGHPIDHYFHSLFLSYEMKAYKPDRRIFDLAMQADGMRPEECIFVDDSQKNIDAANALGIHGLHVPTNQDWRTPLDELLQQLS